MTKEEMIQLANEQISYENARMQARKQYEQQVIQAIAQAMQATGIPNAIVGSPALPGQQFPKPGMPGQPPAPGQAPTNGVQK